MDTNTTKHARRKRHMKLRSVQAGKRIRTRAIYGAVCAGTALDGAGKFDVEVPIGAEGVVLEPHPSQNLPGWWLVRVVLDGKEYDMPLTTYQIEVQAI